MKVERFIIEFWNNEHEKLSRVGLKCTNDKMFLTPTDELTDDEIIAGWKEFTTHNTIMFSICKELSSGANTILFKVIQFALACEDVRLGYEKLSAISGGKSKRTIQRKIKELEDLGLVSTKKDGDECIFKVNRKKVNDLFGFDYFECD